MKTILEGQISMQKHDGFVYNARYFKLKDKIWSPCNILLKGSRKKKSSLNGRVIKA